MALVTHPQTTARLDAIEKEALRNTADAKRRTRVAEAQEHVRSFAGEHIDICAMALITLRWIHPGETITRTMVKERVLAMYPDVVL